MHTYADEVAQLKAWITQRQAWVNENLEDLPNQICTVTFIAGDEVVMTEDVQKDRGLNSLPDAPQKEGYIFVRWADMDGNEPPEFEALTGDVTYYAEYIDEKDATKAVEIFFQESRIFAPLRSGESGRSLHYAVLPEDAQNKIVKWDISDDSIAEMATQEGMLKLKKTGTVTITGTLASGASATCELTVYDPNEVDPVPAQRVETGVQSLTIGVGEHAFIPATVYPKDQPVKEYYMYTTSDDEDIVAAGDAGVIYGISPGRSR